MALNNSKDKDQLNSYYNFIEKGEDLYNNLIKDDQIHIEKELADEYITRDSFLSKVSVSKGWLLFWLKVNRKGIMVISSSAAALLLLLMLFTPFVSNIPIDNQVSLQHDILPADGKVTIQLSSGEIIPIDSVSVISERISGVSLDKTNQTISYQNISEDNEVVNKKRVEDIKNNVLNIPKGKSYSLVLSDGTKVWINSESSVEYPIVFSKDKRVVKVVGEAFFDVKEDASRPFIVETSGYQVKVLGTKFNVKSYSDDLVSATTLVSGAVDILSNKLKESISIKPGQQFTINSISGAVDVKEVDTDIYTSWIDNRLKLDQMPLNEIIKLLMRRYDVDFYFSDETAKNELFNGVVPLNDNLNVILWQLSKVSSLSFEIEGDLIIVKKRD